MQRRRRRNWAKKGDSFYVVIDIGHIKQSSSKYEQYLLKFITFSISNIFLSLTLSLARSSVRSCHVYVHSGCLSNLQPVVCIVLCLCAWFRSFEFNYATLKCIWLLKKINICGFVLCCYAVYAVILRIMLVIRVMCMGHYKYIKASMPNLPFCTHQTQI